LLHALDEVSEARWRFLAPGVKAIDLPLAHDKSTARLVKLKPGMKIPLHDHDGAELTLIFTGALSDDVGTYQRGDLSFRLPGHRHVQRVASGDDCIALQVNEGPLKPLTLKGRLLRLIVRD
jgi:putative transcriptional regulator